MWLVEERFAVTVLVIRFKSFVWEMINREDFDSFQWLFTKKIQSDSFNDSNLVGYIYNSSWQTINPFFTTEII